MRRIEGTEVKISSLSLVFLLTNRGNEADGEGGQYRQIERSCVGAQGAGGRSEGVRGDGGVLYDRGAGEARVFCVIFAEPNEPALMLK